MKREEWVEQLLTRDRELMAGLKDASPDQMPALLRQRKQVKSQMNLYGPAATERLLRQDFAEYADLVTEREEARRARRAKHLDPEELELLADARERIGEVG